MKYTIAGMPERNSVTNATTHRKPVMLRSSLCASPAHTPAITFSSLLLYKLLMPNIIPRRLLNDYGLLFVMSRLPDANSRAIRLNLIDVPPLDPDVLRLLDRLLNNYGLSDNRLLNDRRCPAFPAPSALRIATHTVIIITAIIKRMETMSI